MESKVLENLEALKSFHASMGCALGKAQNGSDVEDSYFMEKLEKTVNRMGYLMVQKCQADK